MSATIEPGEVWSARLPGVAGEMIVVTVEASDGAGLVGCAVVDATWSMPYKEGTLHRWPLGNNDCWERLT